MGYTKISESKEAMIRNGHLYVRSTDMWSGALVSGGYVGRVYKMPYNNTIEDAQLPNYYGITDIDRCVESGKIVRNGRLIH